LDARFATGLARAVEALGVAFVVVQRPPVFVFQVRADQELVADSLGRLDGLVDFGLNVGQRNVGGRRGQAVAIEGRQHIFWRFVVIAGEFDFLVSDSRDLFERALKIFSHLGAHGVELYADTAEFARRRFALDPVQRRQRDGSDYALTRS